MPTAANQSGSTPDPVSGRLPSAWPRWTGRSLFWKIYAWFLLAVLVLAGVTAVTVYFTDPDLLFAKRRYIPIELRDKQATRSAEIFEREGTGALRRYLDDLPRTLRANRQYADARPLEYAYLVNREGQEVSGATLPDNSDTLISRAWENGDEHIEMRFNRALVAHATAGPSGAPYVFLSTITHKSLFVPVDFLGWVRLGVLLAAAAGVCYWLACSVANPVRLLRSATRRLTAGDLGARADPILARRQDEFSELARDFDDMASRMEELVTAQRRLIADVSHELGSPLTRVNVALGLAFRKAAPESRPALERIERETQRLSGLIHQLLLLSELESRATMEPPEVIDLREVIDEVASDATFEAENAGRGVRVVAPSDGRATVRGRRRLVSSAVENVVRNALRYTARGTEVRIELLGGTNGTATVRIQDRGPGVPEDALEHLFEPFFRVSEARDRQSGGAGLGLAIADRAVQAHGGSMRATNAAEGGLCVEIDLPKAQSVVS